VREDVVVVGEGPAGSALAAACAEAGLPTTHLGTDHDAGWPATYGAWTDEVDGVPGVRWSHRWPAPHVAFDGAPPRALDRTYGLLDNAGTRAALRDRAVDAGAVLRTGRAAGVAHDADGSRVLLADGGEVAAGVVVDATGHRPVLARPGVDREPAWQVAYGIVGRIAGSPVPEGGMAFMDWRTDGLEPRSATPSFLYAMDLGGGRTFLEETSLAARPAVGVEELRGRLDRRLAAVGARVAHVESVERVAFPMGVALPPHPQRVLAWGAAAGMVHPATGYSVAGAISRAPDVAAALAGALAGPGPDPDEVAAAAWSAVWPADRVRQRQLHAYGLEVLLALDATDVQRFFRAFFALPAARWQGYLSGAGSSRELATTMLAVARRLPPRLQWRVSSGAFGADGVALLRAALSAG
jgi:lycopene cyclase-like protein